MSVNDILISVGAVVLTFLQIILSNAIAALVFAHRRYPDLTAITVVLLGSYATYRILKKSAKMWINFIFTLIKLVVVLTIVLSGVMIYFRGWKFYEQDISFIYHAFQGILNLSGFMNETQIENFVSQIGIAFSKLNSQESAEPNEFAEFVNYIKSNFDFKDMGANYDYINELAGQGAEYLDKVDLKDFAEGLFGHVNQN
ncbi:uncharacterized protein SPAPADRAFT_48890 [Spathaspora passalidarum NRRL Y-27907]|uniref:Uncharacterized protein n=1 Tax=Spathaspora passalidarum (strain NRRL Y-27907 / 11-Y1) TaxID=619300 RepID=G3AIW2_SPAPN|nr:uncharacterized protein SPAPADRAFT_48890 [Spathaspora passalidarum NRRL Y-27907]EGW33773.1 hypothetical protein SPAPADRAFT_48890 [Spathaspora passalidarum NRRL Y-27907]